MMHTRSAYWGTRWFALLPLLVLLWAAALPARAAAPVDPSVMVQQELNKIVGFFARETSPEPADVHAFVSSELAPHFDFDYMAKWAAGSYLRRLSDEDLERLSARIQSMFLGGLTRGLYALGPRLPTVQVFPARMGRDSRERIVPARATLGPTQARLSFRCYWTGESWKVFDASLNGASAVAFFRRYFSEQLRRHGPQALSGPAQ